MTKAPFWLHAEDWHTAGEPFRIVKDLPKGYLNAKLTVAEQREEILRTKDHPLDLLRRTLCHEPRGHADMYGGFIMPPDDDGAQFGVLFWHKDGFSTACGHGTIALGHWAFANGCVPLKSVSGRLDVAIDVPSGRVVAQVFYENSVARHVDFVNVKSYQLSGNRQITLRHEGKNFCINVTLSFAGAVYASVEAKELGLDVCSKNYGYFINLQRQIRKVLGPITHQDKYDLYGVIFFDHLDEEDTFISQRNVVVFADGQVDRSPCGSGTCARLAVLLAQGKLEPHKTLMHSSIIKTRFEATINALVSSPTEFPACIPCVRGKACLVGRHQFYIDESDPIFPGFLFS